MKKQFAIFSLFIFFLAQFGRTINFCICAATVYEQTGTVVCDCEKQLFTGLQTDRNAAHQDPQRITAARTTEELFHPVSAYSFTSFIIIATTDRTSAGAEALCHRFGNDIFHPPAFL